MDIDFLIFNFLHSCKCSATVHLCTATELSKIFYWISDHSHILWFALVLLIAIFRGPKQYFPVFICIGGFFVAWHLNDELIKPFFHRERPFLTHEEICVFGEIPSNLSSFPSGHTITSFAMAMMIALYNRNIPLQVLVFAFALFNGYLRIYLGVHYPTDILGGAIFGMGIGWLWYTLVEWTRKNYQSVMLRK